MRLNFERSDNGLGEVIIEEFLEGPLFSLESVTTSPGKHIFWGYTDRVLTEDFIEVGATFPAAVPDDVAGKQLVAAALEAIGFDFGSCHTEMIFTSMGPRIVEINPRPGGSGVCRLVERATDQNVLLDYIKMFLGENPSTALSTKRAVSMRCVLPDYSGRIVSLPLREQLLRLSSVKDVWFQRKLGDNTDDSRSNFSWLFTVLTEGSDQSSAARASEAAINSARVEIGIEGRERAQSCLA